MRLEPLGRRSDWVALVAVICGLAPLPFGLLSLVPIVGCISTPVMLLAVPGAIGFGIAGVVRARAEPEPSYLQPLTGLILGLLWGTLMAVGVVWLTHGRMKSFEL